MEKIIFTDPQTREETAFAVEEETQLNVRTHAGLVGLTGRVHHEVIAQAAKVLDKPVLSLSLCRQQVGFVDGLHLGVEPRMEPEDACEHKHLERLPAIDVRRVRAGTLYAAAYVNPTATAVLLPFSLTQPNHLPHFALVELIGTQQSQELHSAKDLISIVRIWFCLQSVKILLQSRLDGGNGLLRGLVVPLAKDVMCYLFFFLGHIVIFIIALLLLDNCAIVRR